jgi:hypothetical protein
VPLLNHVRLPKMWRDFLSCTVRCDPSAFQHHILRSKTLPDIGRLDFTFYDNQIGLHWLTDHRRYYLLWELDALEFVDDRHLLEGNGLDLRALLRDAWKEHGLDLPEVRLWVQEIQDEVAADLTPVLY